MTDKECIEKIWNESPMGRMGCGTPMVIAILFGVLFLLTSCKTKTVIEYRDRDVEKIVLREVHDTLREQVRDSTIIREKGDTLYIEKWHTHYRDKIVEKHDTVRNDSIVTEYKETEKEVVKYPKSYWWAIGFSILFFIFAFIKLTRWLRIL